MAEILQVIDSAGITDRGALSDGMCNTDTVKIIEARVRPKNSIISEAEFTRLVGETKEDCAWTIQCKRE